MAKQIWNGKMDDVIQTVERNDAPGLGGNDLR